MLRVLIDYTNGSNFRGRTEEDLYITSKIIYFTVNKGDSRYEFSCTNHRQPKRTVCGFGLQRSFGGNTLELLVYYLMPNKCKKS